MPTESRLKDIFPPGIDSASNQTGSHYNLKLEQLYYSLIERYNPNTHVETVVVKSAWYGKQTRSAEHEFILIQVEDTAVEGLTNYLVLDRNVGGRSHGTLGKISRSWTSSQATMTIDTFRVSYDGDVKQLLEQCQLIPYKAMEQLQFESEAPLRLYELVTLACVVSSRYPLHRAVYPSRYLFVGLVWECMHRLRPNAIHEDVQAKQRGRFSWIRSTPNAAEMEEIDASIQEQLAHVELELEDQRAVCYFNMILLAISLTDTLKRSEGIGRNRRNEAAPRELPTED
jgi:hypothetical protein